MNNIISVIVPIYNVAPYLYQCIDSIINQTYKNLDIILVDDGSTDASGYICDEYAKQDSRIVVVHQKNQGLICARKLGVNIAKGEYIAFVDGDDWVEPQMYENLLNVMIKTNADFIDSNYIKRQINNKLDYMPNRNLPYITYVNEDIRSELIKNMLLDNISENNYISPSIWSKLIKKDILKKAQQFIDNKISYGEDLICTLYLIQFSNVIAYTDTYFYNYRIRDGSITKQNNLVNIVSELFNMMKEIYKFFDEYNYNYQNFANYRVIKSLLMYSNTAQDNLCKNYPLYRFPDKEILKNKDIVLYGAGVVGLSYYNYHKNDTNIICWTDVNYQNLNNYPEKIESPDSILNYNFDYLIIAVKNQNLANSIKYVLISKGIPEEKILWNKPQNTLNWLL